MADLGLPECMEKESPLSRDSGSDRKVGPRLQSVPLEKATLPLHPLMGLGDDLRSDPKHLDTSVYNFRLSKGILKALQGLM